jgi:alpha-glucuronidase
VITTAASSLADKPVMTGLRAQGYAIRSVARGERARVWVIGADASGAMYGAIELAETVQIAGTLKGISDRPPDPGRADEELKHRTRSAV